MYFDKYVLTTTSIAYLTAHPMCTVLVIDFDDDFLKIKCRYTTSTIAKNLAYTIVIHKQTISIAGTVKKKIKDEIRK